jgi:uncharacterized protein YdbL (DUF1318 family)
MLGKADIAGGLSNKRIQRCCRSSGDGTYRKDKYSTGEVYEVTGGSIKQPAREGQRLNPIDGGWVSITDEGE